MTPMRAVVADSIPPEPVPLQISRRNWRRLMGELRRRGRGERESGAFLLVSQEPQARRIVDFIPFDDLDRDALNGAISIHRHAFAQLWKICAEHGLRVAADIHTHPGRSVRQSPIDQANPMVATVGHFGIIVPRFAQDRPSPDSTGVHVYQGNHAWLSFYGVHATELVRRTWW
jgi:proteasome lid subunit RPN8/RPN11